MLELKKNSRIMVVAAHPDDEVLGAGATIHKLINEFNANIHVVILGEGITSRDNNRDTGKRANELDIHRQNIHTAQNLLGYQSLSVYNLPDNRFDSVPLLDIIKVIEKEKQNFSPEVILTHHYHDLNIDHRRTFEAVLTACRPLENETVKTIITFEVPSSTEWQIKSSDKRFNPNFYISVSSENLKAKIKAMEAYEFEKREYPHPRSPEALEVLAKYNAINVGSNYAEAFCIVRHIN